MNRIDRLVAIILYLQGRRLSRAEEIAGHFETSLRTVYRDIAALGEAGVPIVSEAGVGYSLLKGYHLPPVTFTPEEASALATGGVLVEQMTDPSLTTQMRSALLKIRAVLPREQQERLERIDRATLVRERSADARGNNSANLLQIQDALAKRHVTELRYRSGRTGDLTLREVEPLGLVQYRQRWHLIAWCRLRQGSRDFRLDRIESLSVKPELFVPREGVQLDDYIRRITAHEEGVTIRVRFSAESADRARREWSLGVVREESERDGVVLTLTAGVMEWFVSWLLSFGSQATILAPAELRHKLAEAAEATARHHRVPLEKLS